MKTLVAVLTASLLLPIGARSADTGAKKTLGFVVVSWRTAQYETKYYEECPEGLAIGNDEIWWKSLSPKDRDRLTNGGLIEPVDMPRRSISALRGPNHEDVCWNPEIVKDPPLRTVKGKFGYGLNLDGTDDGHATSTSCRHEKFTTPDGQTKVDNQMYRLVGCIYGWRKGNYAEAHADRERRDASVGTILIEVSGVDDERNDSDVDVTFYTTRDILPKDAAGNILPYASFRVSATPVYGATAKGKIVDGQLITEAVDAHLPLYAHQYTGSMFIRGLKLQLPLTTPAGETTHNGMLAGYFDFDSWWDYTRRLESILVTAQWSCPAIYVAAKELADGYPDPKTGQCTGISTAMNIEALPAFVIHEDAKAAPAYTSR